jgi:prophage tail gpP-like protein
MGLQVLINGAEVRGLLHANITTNNYFSSDHFALTFALGSSVLDDLASWAGLSDPYVEVTYSESKFAVVTDSISGMADSLVADPISGTVSIEGRDLSARLIDSYLQRDFVNQTASEIVETIAGQHGLVAQATATSGNVGRYFGDGYTKLSLGQFSRFRSNWDLVVQLARERNFDVFVQGTTLIFQPVTNAFAAAVQIRPADVTRMRLEKNLAIQPSAKIKVQSWNSQQKISYNATTTNTAASPFSGDTAANAQIYLFSKSNLTSSQTDLSVQQYAGELARLRTILHVEMPWNMSISPRSTILLQETQSSFDGLYLVDNLERRYSSVTGSSQTIHAVSWPVAS